MTDKRDDWTELATQLAVMPGTWRRLLALHVPDGDGRCRACTTPGLGTPRDPWPCSLCRLAQRAAAEHAKAMEPLRSTTGEPIEEEINDQGHRDSAA